MLTDRQTDRQTVTKIEGVILDCYFESVNKKTIVVTDWLVLGKFLALMIV